MISEIEFEMIENFADENGVCLSEMDDDTVVLSIQLCNDSFDVDVDRELTNRLVETADKCVGAIDGLTSIVDGMVVVRALDMLPEDCDVIVLRK